MGFVVIEEPDLKPVVDAGLIAVSGEEREGGRCELAPDGVPVVQNPKGLHVIGNGKGMGVGGELALGVGRDFC